MYSFYFQILDEKITYAKHKVEFNEISTTGGYLSSAVLLINRNKKPNSIVSNITREDTTNYSEWRAMQMILLSYVQHATPFNVYGIERFEGSNILIF